MRFEIVNCKSGWQRLFYITENGEALLDNSSPSIHCHTPRGVKVDCNVRQLELELGIFAFDFLFIDSGKYVFVCSENGSPSMIIVATVKK